MHSSSVPQLLASRILSLDPQQHGVETAFDVLSVPVAPGTLNYYIPAMSLAMTSIADVDSSTKAIVTSQAHSARLKEIMARNPELEKLLYQSETLLCAPVFTRATYLPFILSISPDPKALWENVLQYRPEFSFNAKATVAGWFNAMMKDHNKTTGNTFLNQDIVNTIQSLVSPEFFKRWAYAVGMISFGRSPHYRDEFKNSRYAIGRTLIHDVMPLFLAGFDVKEMISGSFKKYKSSELTLDWLRGMEALNDESLKSPYGMDDRKRLSKELLTVFMPNLFESGYATKRDADQRVDTFLTKLFNENLLEKKVFLQWVHDRGHTIKEPGFFQAAVSAHLSRDDSWEIVRYFKQVLVDAKAQHLKDFEAIAFRAVSKNESLSQRVCDALNQEELESIKTSITGSPSYFSLLTIAHPAIRHLLKHEDIKKALLEQVLTWAVGVHYSANALPIVGGLLPPFDFLNSVFPELEAQWNRLSNQIIDSSSEEIFNVYSSGAPHSYNPFTMSAEFRLKIANELGNVFFKGMNLSDAMSAQKALDIPFSAKATVELALSCAPKHQQDLNFEDFNIDFNVG